MDETGGSPKRLIRRGQPGLEPRYGALSARAYKQDQVEPIVYDVEERKGLRSTKRAHF